LKTSTPAVQWYQWQLLTADADAFSAAAVAAAAATTTGIASTQRRFNDVSALVLSRDIAQVSFDARRNDVLQTSPRVTLLHLRQCFQRPVSIR